MTPHVCLSVMSVGLSVGLSANISLKGGKFHVPNGTIVIIDISLGPIYHNLLLFLMLSLAYITQNSRPLTPKDSYVRPR